MDKNTIALVAWSILELPKNMGGLNIGSLLHRNLSLLFKWVWNYFKSPSSLWRNLIQEKYKYPQNLTLRDLSIPKSGGPWKFICASLLRHSTAKQIMMNGVRVNIGDGSSTLFWHDVWIENIPLKRKFRSLFLLAVEPNGSIASYSHWDGLKWVWSFSWTRVLRIRDEEEKKELLLLLQRACPSFARKDSLVWVHDKNGRFSTKSFALQLAKSSTTPHCDAIKGL